MWYSTDRVVPVISSENLKGYFRVSGRCSEERLYVKETRIKFRCNFENRDTQIGVGIDCGLNRKEYKFEVEKKKRIT